MFYVLKNVYVRIRQRYLCILLTPLFTRAAYCSFWEECYVFIFNPGTSVNSLLNKYNGSYWCVFLPPDYSGDLCIYLLSRLFWRSLYIHVFQIILGISVYTCYPDYSGDLCIYLLSRLFWGSL